VQTKVQAVSDIIYEFIHGSGRPAPEVVPEATVFIYGLNDPRTGKCRYIGKSDSPPRRFEEHCIKSAKSNTHKDRWIAGLLREGLCPVLEVLDEVPACQWQFWEREYIRVFRMIGFKLTNTSSGGEGFSKGHSVPLEVRKKIQLSKIGERNHMFGKKRSSETLARVSASCKLAWVERRKKPSTVLKGDKNPCFGKRRSPETRAKISAAGRGRAVSLETRAKMSASQKARQAVKRAALSKNLKISGGGFSSDR
jgi:hypothetical protein